MTASMRVTAAPARFLVGVAISLLALGAMSTCGCVPERASLPPFLPPVAAPPPSSDSASFTAIDNALIGGGLPAVERRFGKPTAKYRMPDVTNSAEPSATYKLPDGRSYVFSWGFDSAGTPVIVRHTVMVGSGVPLTPQDRAFIAAIHDGRSSLADATAYLLKLHSGKLSAVAPGRPSARDVTLLWLNPDGSGFTISSVLSNRSLTMFRHSGVPYTVWNWSADHVWVVSDL